MLEIFAIIFLSGKIGDLAIYKNQPKGKWKAIFIIGWILAEVLGAFIGYFIFQSLFPAVLVGMGCAVSVYFIIKNYLQNLPDADDYDIQNIGSNQ
jgi:hypothetical protein